MTRKNIIQILMPLTNQVIEAQGRGMCMLSHKISYPLSRMLNRAIAAQKDLDVIKDDLLKKYCELEEDGSVKIIDEPSAMQGQPPRKVYKFKSDADNKLYMDEMNKVLDEDVKFDTNMIPLKELEACKNFPILALSQLDKLGLISEMNIVSR